MKWYDPSLSDDLFAKELRLIAKLVMEENKEREVKTDLNSTKVKKAEEGVYEVIVETESNVFSSNGETNLLSPCLFGPTGNQFIPTKVQKGFWKK